MNTKSSTEAELVGIDDVLPQMLWTRYFLESQGYGTNTILHEDNQSTMKLADNGKASSGKRRRHINICYFFITDRIAKKEVTILYCPTKQMVVDFLTKPLQGALFYKFRDQIMGLAPMETIHEVQRSVLDVKRTSDWTIVSPKKRTKSDSTRTRKRTSNDVRGHQNRMNGHRSWAAVARNASSPHPADMSRKRSILRQ